MRQDMGLLEVAQFLSDNLALFSAETMDEEVQEGVVVTVEDLAQVYSLRKHLKDLEEIRQEYEHYRRELGDDGVEYLEVKSHLDEKEKLCQGFSVHVRECHALLDRFELWSTKALAQHLLISHDDPKVLPQPATCWSHVLSQPTTSYSRAAWAPQRLPEAKKLPLTRFGKAWEEFYYSVDSSGPLGSDDDPETDGATAEGSASPCAEQSASDEAEDEVTITRHAFAKPDHFPCALSIPPNAYTYPEYVEVCRMVSWLPDPSLVHSAAFQQTGQHGRSMLYAKHTWSPQDLVALWIRARRNVQSRRHLVQLFVAKQQNGRISVRFSGNHKGVLRKASSDFSKVADQIAEWSITNLFWGKDAMISSRMKRTSQGTVQDDSRMLKKPRIQEDSKLGEPTEKTLKRACQRFLLRSFCHRHKLYLSSLFFSNATEAALAKKAGLDVNPEMIDLLQSEMCSDIKDLLESSDRTFPRIDRRVDTSKYEGADHDIVHPEAIDLFHDVVLSLLVAYEKACQKNHVGDDIPFSELKDDFSSRYIAFHQSLKDSGILPTSIAFLDLSQDTKPGEVSNLLLQYPSPWIERCMACQGTPFPKLGQEPNAAMFRVCVSCNACMHCKCIPKKDRVTYSSRSFIESYVPLKEAFQVKIPPVLIITDFTSHDFKWETRVVTVQRSLMRNGRLQTLDIQFRHTEHCREQLLDLKDGRISMDKLKTTNWHPVDVPPDGVLVTSIGEKSPAFKKLKLGDVITGVQVSDYLDEHQHKIMPQVVQELGPLTAHARVDILQQQARTMKFIVQRPQNANVVHEPVALVERLRNFNERTEKAIDLTSEMWFCPQCSETPQKRVMLHSKQEATFSKAVIRRLASIYENSPCLDEDRSDENSEQHALSLKRLDLMMSSLSHKSPQIPKELSAFTVDGRPLSWLQDVDEDSPYELICTGLATIAAAGSLSRNDSANKHLRTWFIADFLKTFCAWCLSSLVGEESLPIHTRGPTDYGLVAPFATRGAYCESCGVRQRDESSCLCKQCMQSSVEEQRAASTVETQKLRIHQEFSGLVGASILCCPDSNLVREVGPILKELKVDVEHHGRVVEFQVIAYCPSSGEDSGVRGWYFLLPLVTTQQLTYVLGLCQSRLPQKDGAWQNDSVLGLKGVARVSDSQMLQLSSESVTILRTIDECVEMFAKSESSSEIEHDSSRKRVRATVLLQMLLRTANPILGQMLGDEGKEMSGYMGGALLPQVLQGSHTIRNWGSRAPEKKSLIFAPQTFAMDDVTIHYCDVLFSNEANAKDFDLKLPLARPERTEVCIETHHRVVLPYSCQPFRERGGMIIGWGFEIVQWKDEEILRIGRVVPESPAERAGIKRGDALESINGKSLGDPKEATLLLALLGLTIDEKEKRSLLKSLQFALSNAKRIGPVILKIRRTDNCAPSEPSSGVFEPPMTSLPTAASKTTWTELTPQFDDEPDDRHKVQHRARTQERLLDHGVRMSWPLPTAPKQVRQFRPSMMRPLIQSIHQLSLGSEHASCINQDHLHRFCYSDCSLTIAEMALLIACFTRSHSMLGLRMLYPRYDTVSLIQHLERLTLARRDLRRVPRLTEEIWEYLTSEDYRRTQGESGDFVFIEEDENFRYQAPSRPLPVDQLLHQYFTELSATHGSLRLRGGGAAEPVERIQSHEGEVSLNQVVRFRTRVQEGKAMKVVAFIESQSEDGFFVAIFYVFGMGVVKLHSIKVQDANILKPVTKSCQELSAVEEWIALQGTKYQLNDDIFDKLVISEIADWVPKDLWRTKSDHHVGSLPDGSVIYYFDSDPTSLYKTKGCYDERNVAWTKTMETAFSKAVSLSFDKHPCVFGCMLHSRSGYTHFSMESSESVQDHMRRHHNFVQEERDGGGLFRIRADKIGDLLEAVTAAACALDPTLLQCTEETGKQGHDGTSWRKSASEKLLCFKRSALSDRLQRERSGPESLELTALRIMTLFDKEGQSKRVRKCFRDVSPALVHDQYCRSCTLGTEKSISESFGYESLSCYLCCDKSLSSTKLGIAHLNSLLLAVESRIPDFLKLVPKDNETNKACCLWTSTKHNMWRVLVENTHSSRVLLQAFILLLGAIDQTKLPMWWNHKNTGWQMPVEDDTSMLYCHLYVLEAAVGEVKASAVVNQLSLSADAFHLPSEWNGKSYSEISQAIFNWEVSSGRDVFKGINGSYCCVCDDGGELLCCELCSNVQHLKCVRPVLSAPPLKFVCNCCIMDISTLMRNSSHAS